MQVLRSLMMEPEPDLHVTVVLDRPVAVYSGMVPGFVAGDYAASDLEIDVVPLARRAGAAVVFAAATRIDAESRLVHVAGRPPLPYDVASLNVGSTVKGLDLPGVREHCLPTRPIGRLARLLPARLDALPSEPRVVVVGAGAGGTELAFTLDARIRAEGRTPRVTLVDSGDGALRGYPSSTRSLVAEQCQERGITVVSGRRVAEVRSDAVVLDDGRALPCDLPVWVTGAGPLPFLTASDLPTDEAGFVRVRETLQVEGHDDLFAVGDCAALPWAPWVRKAGVYAVREGPVLTDNLRAWARSEPLERYAPQKDFLALLNLGGGEAVASKWGLSRQGGWVWRLKDRIDRRFMEKFTVLTPDGRPAPDFPAMDTDEPMQCGGCAAKVGADVLAGALDGLPPATPDANVVLGLEHADDAAAVRTPRGDTLVTTVDAFEAFTDDPWMVGRVAAVNAASDLLAKGIDPAHALCTVGVPDGRPEQVRRVLSQALAGVRATLDLLGATLLGGHTTRAEPLTVGLTVTGYLPDGGRLLSNDGARVGDHLLLSKPLGTGVVFFADMQGRAPGPVVEAALASMQRDNRRASLVARELASAATDISGFGLAVHLSEVCAASGVGAELELDALPALPGALELMAQGLRSTFHPSNERSVTVRGGLGHPRRPLLFDPQTSGGLLLCVPEGHLAEALERLPGAARIGRLVEGDGIVAV